jgi:hypothetical protein
MANSKISSKDNTITKPSAADATDLDDIFINYYENVDMLFINKQTNYCCNHVSDLTLAAELGKTLLERNQDLQTNVVTLEQIIIEKNREIQVNILFFLNNISFGTFLFYFKAT